MIKHDCNVMYDHEEKKIRSQWHHIGQVSILPFSLWQGVIFFSLALRTLIVIITFDSYHNISSTRFRTWRNIYPSFVFFI
ncbi:hypothetical protein COCSADRAFT_324312 [Bipolaris sorokiniana ND90Pr]|uniref:Uncharacterized protein n=1 Tax=Cochliobolus sativus (strain ND90Pr / ATCC 201652) TaxID=665912 RepID=M2SAJ0_COCSN|nr:uncharacterized protein COCSADRAFT_324312 [Bipolaris sorokiniana ND90Pr]EMD64358.1 hypothetical protein COCSADRAFT_324312 [Bipolaris sorokiniana ND90Pr]